MVKKTYEDKGGFLEIRTGGGTKVEVGWEWSG